MMPRSVRSSLRIKNVFATKIRNLGNPTAFGGDKKSSTLINTVSEWRKKKGAKTLNQWKMEWRDAVGLCARTSNHNYAPSTIFGSTQKRYHKWIGEERKVIEEGASVVIIGAGLAGLSAANHLINHGITNINIYEATSRLGGRINTARFLSGGSCELGAEWLSGDMTNGLVALASQEGLTADADWRYDRKIICLLSEGKALSSDVCYLGRKIFNRIREEVFRLYKSGGDITHGTVAYYLGRRISEELNKYSDNLSDDLKRLMCALKNDLRVRYGAELSMMSSDTIGLTSEEPGNAMRLKGGLVNALLPLVRDIPPARINLNTPVKTVLWETHKCSVILENNRQVQADYIIVTVPLGYLKKYHQTFFHPHLPPYKIEAIEKLGVGNITKIIMKYPMKLWGSKRIEISTLWKSRDWSERDIYWFKGVSSVSVQDDVATVSIGGPEAVYAESESVDTLARDLTAMLRCFTGSTFLPLPTEVFKSRYNTDDWYNGSGCYMSIHAKPSHLVDLAKPLQQESGSEKRSDTANSGENPRILFAGEATFPENINTVQGARKSGIREAQRIIDMVCQPTEIAFEFKRKSCTN